MALLENLKVAPGDAGLRPAVELSGGVSRGAARRGAGCPGRVCALCGVVSCVRDRIHGDGLTPGDRRTGGHLLFLDIEGFSLLVQKHSPEQINRTIETYFSTFLRLK